MEETVKRAVLMMDRFEEICGQARNHTLFLSIRNALAAGMENGVLEKAFSIAKDKGNGHPNYASAVIGGFLRRGQLREEEIPGYKKTVAERNYIAQKEPTGELLDWEKQWLREMGRTV